MKHYNNYILYLLMFLCLSACEQQEKFDYAAGNQIFFEQRDSVTYSFAVHASTVYTDTFYIPVSIYGPAADVDRTINIRIDETRTTAQRGKKNDGAVYDFGKTIMPAGKWSANIAVCVFRQPQLKDKEVEVFFLIEPGADFQGGTGIERTSLKFKINDILTEPENWDSYIAAYFGTYGPIKYQFIIDVLGRHSFPASGPDAVVKGQMSFYRDKLRTELIQYEKENGPLMEGTVKVQF